MRTRWRTESADSGMRVIFGAASQGQTFTTGSNPNGYDVIGITVRLAGSTNNTGLDLGASHPL